MSERVRGRVKFFHRLKGFGFILDESGQDYFFPWRDIDSTDSFRYVDDGADVSFAVEEQDTAQYKYRRAKMVRVRNTDETTSEV